MAFESHVEAIQNGVGDKVAFFINFLGLNIASVTAALIERWTLALFFLGILPIGLVIMIFFVYVMMKKKSSASFY